MPEDTLSTSTSDDSGVATGDLAASVTDTLSSPMPDDVSLSKGKEGSSHGVYSPLPRRGIEEEEGEGEGEGVGEKEGEGVGEGEGEGEEGRQGCVWLQYWPM